MFKLDSGKGLEGDVRAELGRSVPYGAKRDIFRGSTSLPFTSIIEGSMMKGPRLRET